MGELNNKSKSQTCKTHEETSPTPIFCTSDIRKRAKEDSLCAL